MHQNVDLKLESAIHETIMSRLLDAGVPLDEAFATSVVYASFYASVADRAGYYLQGFLNDYPLPHILSSERFETGSVEETESFRRWAKTDKEVIQPDDVNDHDFSRGGPFVLIAHHGTSHEFEQFDASKKGNKEGQFGAVNYFTTSFHDADANYSGIGPDMKNKIDKLVERYIYDYDWMEEHGLNPDAEYSENEPAVKRIVEQELLGPASRVMSFYIRTEKPFIVGDHRPMFIEFVDFDELEQKVRERVADNEGFSLDDLDEDFDWSEYEDQMDEIRWEIHDETENPLIQAINDVACYWDIDPANLLADVTEMATSGTNMNELEKTLRESYSLMDAMDLDTDELISSHFIGQVIEKLGYDSIILKNADSRFSNMEMDYGTAHIHVFDSYKTNIKSIDNIGIFNPDDPRFMYQSRFGTDGIDHGSEPKGSIRFPNTPRSPAVISLYSGSDASTFLHETAHHFMFILEDLEKAGHDYAVEDMNVIRNWFMSDVSDIARETSERVGVRVSDAEVLNVLTAHDSTGYLPMEAEIRRTTRERFARAFEKYLAEGTAPTSGLKSVFETVSRWIKTVYASLTHLDVNVSPEIKGVFDRMLSPLNDEESPKTGPSETRMSPDDLSERIMEILPESRHAKTPADIIRTAMIIAGHDETSPVLRSRLVQMIAATDLKSVDWGKGHAINALPSSDGRIMVSFSMNGKKDNPSDDCPAVFICSGNGHILQERYFENGSPQKAKPKENALDSDVIGLQI